MNRLSQSPAAPLRVPFVSQTSPRQPRPPEPIHLLDERIVALLRDGRLRTGAQLAVALGAAPTAVDAALDRLATGRRAMKAGYALPEERGYGVGWPVLWRLRPPR